MNSFQLGLFIILVNIYTMSSSANLDSTTNGEDDKSSHPLLLCEVINHKMKTLNNRKLIFSCSGLDEISQGEDDSNEILVETRSNSPYSPYYYEKFHRPGWTKNQRKLKFIKNKY
jgi:hypothetical protein